MILKAEKLTKKFNGLEAVSQVDFKLERGEFKSIIGPNGAGKTTLFNLIAGVHQADSGCIFFRNDEITNLPQNRIARLGIVKTYQTIQVFPELTVMENLRVASQPAGSCFYFFAGREFLIEAERKARRILSQVGLEYAAHRPAKSLSHGEMRYLDIGLALAVGPEVLLLDEPTAGMSPAETRQTTRLIKDLARDLGLSVILVEHDMSVVMEISDRIMVLYEGRVFAEDSPLKIIRNAAVQEIYLGKERTFC